jgi:hypothetical protein
MNRERTEKFIAVALGKSRIKHAAKPLTEQEKIVNRMVIKNRAVRNGMSQSQRRAAILRGCC